LLWSSTSSTVISMPVFQLIGISLVFWSLLMIMPQITGSPVPHINLRTIKYSSVVDPVGAPASLLFFGRTNSSPPPTLASFNCFV
jgi:hypothetical protein